MRLIVFYSCNICHFWVYPLYFFFVFHPCNFFPKYLPNRPFSEFLVFEWPIKGCFDEFFFTRTKKNKITEGKHENDIYYRGKTLLTVINAYTSRIVL